MKRLTKVDIIFLLVAIWLPVDKFLSYYLVDYGDNAVLRTIMAAIYFLHPFLLALLYAAFTAQKRSIMAFFPAALMILSLLSLFLVRPFYYSLEFDMNLGRREALIQYIKQNNDTIAVGEHTLGGKYQDLSKTQTIKVISTYPVKVAFCMESTMLGNQRYWVYCEDGSGVYPWELGAQSAGIVKNQNDRWALVGCE